ncbi:MAG: response regulator transcription factor [Acidobacteriota bacterium]|jgi:DNA-binding NarL/FixJ family response regulator
MIRVLIADDHPIVREGLRRHLEEDNGFEVVGEAKDSREAYRMAMDSDPDVLVLDLEMPGRGGLDTLRELKRIEPDLAVLVLSRHEEDPYAVRSIRSGAAGYLSKESVSQELADAIRTVAKGKRYISPSVAATLAMHLEHPEEGKPHESLSDRELQVLCLMGKGMTATEIADELCLSVKTISTYRSRILDKMTLENNAQLIRYAIENKLV